MQAQCPLCSTRVQIDDSKVPDRPFKVRCPKCQATISLPGRQPEVPPPGPAAADPPDAPPVPAAPPPTPEPPPTPAAVARRERLEAGEHDALVALSGPLAPHLRQALERIGYNVDSAEDVEEGARLLEQGVYEVAVTARAASEPGRPETLAQRMLRLPIDARRRVFVVLVGEEFRTADGTQAWASQADLVLHPSDAGRCEHLIRSALSERKRLYQPLVDAARKIGAD